MTYSKFPISKLPEPLFTSQQVREGEKALAQSLEIELYTLMERAGTATFELIQASFVDARHVLVCCGKGNNGGDGYVVARLALLSGYQVTVWQIGDSESLRGDAARAKNNFLSKGGVIGSPKNTVPDDVDIIVDALLGTGICGEVRPFFSYLFDRLNQSKRPIISIDTPSGLNPDTGAITGNAIKANKTITFIGVKQGLVTGRARAFTGELYFAGLGIATTFNQRCQSSATLTAENWITYLPARNKDSHKGSFGKLLVVGGGEGMSGAAYLASAAALRAGGGLVATLAHESSLTPIRCLLPEAMVTEHTSLSLRDKSKWCSALAIGVGLGRTSWSANVFQQTLALASTLSLPMVIDADGLYWLAKSDTASVLSSNHILTPHPGEAAHLLNCQINNIESNRFEAIRAIQNTYGGVIVLKGAGTLVYDGKNMTVCHAGNPGMATGGMGDVLTGTILSQLGQGKSLMQAAILGTLIHSMAADHEALENGEVGMLASDLLNKIRLICNYDMS